MEAKKRKLDQKPDVDCDGDLEKINVVIDHLDDYSLLFIFKMLHPLDWLSLNRVSRRWNRLSALLWGSKLCLSTYYSSPHDKLDYKVAVSVIKNAAPGIKHLESEYNDCGKLKIQLGSYEFSAEGFTENQIFKILSAYSYNIDTMNFEDKYKVGCFETKYFKRLVRSNSELKTLKLRSYSTTVMKEIRSSLDSLTLKNITVDENVADNYKINYKVLKRICQELRTLNIKISAEETKTANDLMNVIALYVPKVVNLSVGLRASQQTPCQLLDFVMKFPQLNKLSIELNKNSVSYKVIRGIVEKCRDLKDINLGKLFTTVKTFRALLTLPKLERLALDVVTDMPPIMEVMPTLEKLSVKFSKSKNHQKIIKWENLIDSMKTMPKLRYLGFFNVPEEIRFKLTQEAISLAVRRGLILVVISDSGNGFVMVMDALVDYDFTKTSSISMHGMFMFLMMKFHTGFMKKVRNYVKNFPKEYKCISFTKKPSTDDSLLIDFFTHNPFEWDMLVD